MQLSKTTQTLGQLMQLRISICKGDRDRGLCRISGERFRPQLRSKCGVPQLIMVAVRGAQLHCLSVVVLRLHCSPLYSASCCKDGGGEAHGGGQSTRLAAP